MHFLLVLLLSPISVFAIPISIDHRNPEENSNVQSSTTKRVNAVILGPPSGGKGTLVNEIIKFEFKIYFDI